MYLRNKFKSGQVVMAVPVGLPLILRYNRKGILERCYIGFHTSENVEVSYNMFDTLYESKLVPVKIPIEGGTTEVYGVLYTGEYENEVGYLPECIEEVLCLKFTEGRSPFNFFAGYAKSTASSMRGAAQVQRWLKYAGFNLLPSFLVPSPLTKESFEYACNHNYTFLNEYIMNYFIYDDDMKIIDVDLECRRVESTWYDSDENGYIHAYCMLDNDEILSMEYYLGSRLKLCKGKYVIIHESNPLISFGKTRSKSFENVLQCKWCGKKLYASESGMLHCNGETCMSTRYTDFTRFLKAYNLPDLDFGTYFNICHKENVKEIRDIFKISPWSQDKIETSLSTLLRALIPYTQVPAKNLIDNFVAKCNDNLNMFHHYIDNPSDISKDFHLTGPYVQNLLRWLSNKNHIKELEHLLDDEHVIISTTGKKFEGAPIFRGKKIMITGEFTHGSHEDIKSILKSYSAEVVETLDLEVDCVVIGSTLENMNSIDIKNAKFMKLPVFEEDAFFSQYEIDEDLQNNLL